MELNRALIDWAIAYEILGLGLAPIQFKILPDSLKVNHFQCFSARTVFKLYWWVDWVMRMGIINTLCLSSSFVHKTKITFFERSGDKYYFPQFWSLLLQEKWKQKKEAQSQAMPSTYEARKAAVQKLKAFYFLLLFFFLQNENIMVYPRGVEKKRN